MIVSPEDFRIPFFTENGFIRKQCKICGTFFWTQDETREECGDAPCVPYEFIGNSPTNRSLSITEMREKFLSFFEQRGHERLRPYPVVARWRDDLLFTIASIVDFQPYVTEGLIPPPANPLVLSQPCLRFEDIDLVGHTMGRHFTIFEMGGHHAFNYENQPQVYWKNETIRYHHELLTQDLGVPSEKITYKEGFWSGGGNAGVDVEGCVSGLEVSTLVFMQYKTIGDKLEPMPIKVVDTGYGMERWTWLTQGSPSAFHAVYGRLLERLLDWAGLQSTDRRVIEESSRFSAEFQRLGKKAARERIAHMVGMDPVELDSIISPIENSFALLDHTKALVFILSEGVVPSNVKEGYLARLLFRRSYRVFRKLDIVDRLPDLLEEQVRYWSGDFPHIRDMREEILEEIEAEKEKYLDTLSRGRRLVSRVVEQTRSEGKTAFPVDQLVELYDSHGLTPEDVKEITEKEGLETPTPEDFYSLVAKRHVAPQETTEGLRAEDRLNKQVENTPKTRRLFYEDPYLREFSAEVLKVLEGRYLVLDQTAFYSEGGGQLSDVGIITADNSEFRVVHVASVDNVLLHEIQDQPELPAPGSRVHGVIDWERRAALMRHHTATHVLIGASRRVLGDHAWQSGAQKSVESSRLDISHWKKLTRQETDELERLANKVVMEARKVSTTWVQRDKAEAQYGFRLYQGGAAPGKQIRIVEIEGWDVEACGGTHCGSTSEVGFIKILRTERVQDGVERIIFAAGPAALGEVQRREKTLFEVAETLGTPLEKVVESLSKVLADRNNLRHEIDSRGKLSAEKMGKELLMKAEDIGGVKVIVYSDSTNVDFLIELANYIAQSDPSSVSVFFNERDGRVVAMVGEEAVTKIHAGVLADTASKFLGGRGGGRPSFGQGGGKELQKIPEAVEHMRGHIKRLLS